MSIFNLSLSPARAMVLCDDMGFKGDGTPSHSVAKVLYSAPKSLLLCGQGTTVVGHRLFQHVDSSPVTTFDELTSVAQHGLDESLDYWDREDGELYVVIMYDPATKTIRAAEINAVSFDLAAQTATRSPATVRELPPGIHLYPQLVGTTVPQSGGVDLLKKAAQHQHTQTGGAQSGGSLWLYTLKKNSLTCDLAGSLT